MAGARLAARMVSDGSTDEPENGATDMNLYTADLMADERMRDRERDFEANQLAALARVPTRSASTRPACGSGSAERPAGSGSCAAAATT